MPEQSTEQAETQATPSSELPLVDVRLVSHRYQDGDVAALRNVSCQVQRGEHVAIVGKSGSGKTTLLNLIGGLDQPSSGEIRFLGETLSKEISLDRHRSNHVGFVFQSYYLLPNLTAIENVQVPMLGGAMNASERQQHAVDLLSRVGLSERTSHLPSRLSGGECQRVAIARSLANQPELILADEPTGALDSQTGQTVLDLLHEFNRDAGIALVVVTHDDTVAAQADRVIRLVDGCVV